MNAAPAAPILLTGLLAGMLSLCLAAEARAETAADASALRVEVSADPWGFELRDARGRTVLAADAARDAAAPGALGFRSAGAWRHATRSVAAHRESGAYVAELATDDPAGRTLELRLSAAGDGVIALVASVKGAGPPVEALGVGFRGTPGERYLGFGERSNAVDQSGNSVESYVSDGPYEADDRTVVQAFVPQWGLRPRDDATYYPVPWLLSSAGYGVLVDDPSTSYFHLGEGGAWSVELIGAPPDEPGGAGAPAPEQLALRFYAGPEPAGALRRFTADTGRQPPPAAPWVFGPWVQPVGSEDEQLAQLDRLREADAPASVAQTYLHYLPCGDQRGRRDAERQRTAAIHDRGLAATTYLNPMICTSYEPVYSQAAANGGLIENQLGLPYLFSYSTADNFQVAELDFSSQAGRDAFAAVESEVIADGHDGWMEDFGEYTPLDSHAADGSPGSAIHNPYPREYHCAASAFAAQAPRPIVRFQRSGWTGAARCAQVVWGGDPTATWGFDGLRSAVIQGLSIGSSGIGRWGSDVGGFFELGDDALTPELLTRWVQFGAVSGVMRMQAGGIEIPAKDKPQIFDDDQLANYRRYAKLRTQLFPYIEAADATYRRTGLPLMRQLAFAYPNDERAIVREDEFLFGPDLLAAPVLEPGAAERSVYLPRGRWVDLGRALRYRPRAGALRVRRARLARGRRDATVPAPLDRLPLLARAGTLLPLLAPRVKTLSGYGSTGGARPERARRIDLIAFPRGRSQAAMFTGERLRSRARAGRWTLRIHGARRRTYRLQASTATIRGGLAPCEVELGGQPLAARRWSYERRTQVLRARFRARVGRLVVRERC